MGAFSLITIIYSQSMSCVTSFSENEMHILIPFCNVWHLNGILRSLSEKNALSLNTLCCNIII